MSDPSPVRASGSELIRQLSCRKMTDKKKSLECEFSRRHSISERSQQPRGRLVRQSTTAGTTRASQRRRLLEERHWRSCEVDPHDQDPPETQRPSHRPGSQRSVKSGDRLGSQRSVKSGSQGDRLGGQTPVRTGSARYSKGEVSPQGRDHVVLILAANEETLKAAAVGRKALMMATLPPAADHGADGLLSVGAGQRHRARVIIILTTLFLLMTCLLLVGITLRLAPLIDEIGELCLTMFNYS